MYFSYFDADFVTDKSLKSAITKLSSYREKVQTVIKTNDATQLEFSLGYVQNPAVHDAIEMVKKRYAGIKHLVLVGIGGSNLGTEAVHSVLDTGAVTLHTLDTVSAHAIEQLLQTLQGVKSVKKIVICVISKSGNTAETMVNANVLLQALEIRFGAAVYNQTIFIGDAATDFMKVGKRLGVLTITMPTIVGGRFSVATEVGLVPLALLGHDTDAFISGVLDATNEELESVVAENAARMQLYINKSYRHYNFFAFEPRLYTLGAWYRQLFAESIGKETDRAGKPVTKGFLPTISTPVELHSVGQLYLSGFAHVYTDFVTFDDDTVDYPVQKKGVGKQYGRFTVQEVGAAIYGGVVAAYQERQLPYRSTIFDENLTYSLGLFMAMRMLETMYVAELMNLNAFDQPNVELYKHKTREILGM
jgi:glucose-6-phosphate isomerase